MADAVETPVTIDAQAPDQAEPASAASAEDAQPAAEKQPEASPEADKVEEPAKESEQPKPPEQPRIASGFAVLARKEQQLAKRAQALSAEAKAREAEFAEREAKLSARLKDVEALEQAREMARVNPLAAMEALGVSYEALTQMVLQDGKLSPEAQARLVEERVSKRLRTWEEQQAEAAKKAEAERQKAQEEAERLQKEQAEAAIAAFREETAEFCRSNTEKYELINQFEAFDTVSEVIEQHWAKYGIKTGKVLSAAEAAELVEKNLEEMAEKATKANKIKRRLEEQFKPPPQAPSGDPKQSNPAQQRTVTSDLGATSTSGAPVGDRYARALQAWEAAAARK